MLRPTLAIRRYRMPAVSRSLQVLAALLALMVVWATLHQIRVFRAAIISDAEREMARLDMTFAEQTGRTVEWSICCCPTRSMRCRIRKRRLTRTRWHRSCVAAWPDCANSPRCCSPMHRGG